MASLENLNHEVYHYHSNSLRLAFSGGELKTKEADSSSAYAVRVLHDSRLGFAYCQQESGLEKALEEAKSLSRFAPKTSFSFAPKASFGFPNIADPSLSVDDFDLIRNFVLEVKDNAASKGGKPRVVCGLDDSSVKIENSNGFSGKYQKTTLSIYAECMHGDGFGYSTLLTNHKPGDVTGLGVKAAGMALAMQGASKPEAGAYTLVFELEALENLIDTLLPSFSGDWRRRKITRLSSGKDVFSDSFSLYEDGLAKHGVAARPFDDEGTPSQKHALVENGVVKSFLYDRETAALHGVHESGACYRESFTSSPSISPSNIVVSIGDRKNFDDLGKFIEVHSAHGSHTANLTTGDIGLEVSAAFLVERENRIRKPLKGFIISGNVFDMFANIEAIEAEQHAYGSLIAPRIAFKNVRVVS